MTNWNFETIRTIVKRVWSLDLKNLRDVEAAIGNADLFAAAKASELSAIADSSERDKEIQTVFEHDLQAVRVQRKPTA